MDDFDIDSYISTVLEMMYRYTLSNKVRASQLAWARVVSSIGRPDYLVKPPLGSTLSFALLRKTT